jgi:hypothetical protein
MATADNDALRPGATREGLLARHPLVFFLAGWQRCRPDRRMRASDGTRA